MNNPWEDINPPNQDISARRIDHTHSLDMFRGRDHIGRYLFIFEFLPEEQKKLKLMLPELTGIQVLVIPAGSSIAVNRLVLILNERSNWELFLTLCDDLVQTTRQAESTAVAVQIILRRLSRWHDFLSRKRSGLMPEEKIKGLIGELLFIRDRLIPEFGAGPAIRFWQGPEGLPQDFNVGNAAVEVKCQSGAANPYVKITSPDQLCPQLPEMYLYVVILGKAPPDTENAVNLPDLAAQIRNLLYAENSDQIERFNDLLYMIGYMESESYRNFSYITAGEKMYHITEGFPRICSSDIHHGIVKLSYHVNLAECTLFEGKPDWMR